MTTILKKTVVLGTLILLVCTAFPSQDKESFDQLRTGLIPHTKEQLKEINETWPEIIRVNINRHGLERINIVRARKGKVRLDASEIKPVGLETESTRGERRGAIQSISTNATMAGDLPSVVDNSKLKYFPPIRNQGPVGSCVSFSTTYTQLSYMNALQRDLDITNDNDNSNKFSPKWTYNMVNGGVDNGSFIYDNYQILERHGASTWAEFPYDGDYLEWCRTSSTWRNALSARTTPTSWVKSVSSDSGIELVKELLTDAYVLEIETFGIWHTKFIQDDPSTPDDDSEVGKIITYWVSAYSAGHAMVLVGYNDAIWTDINDNGVKDAGEEGAFRIADSFGPNGSQDGGFRWLAYDALRKESAVSGGPSGGRVTALYDDIVYVLTVRNNYSPIMTAEFTVNHTKRNQLRISLGSSDLAATEPSKVWTPGAFQNLGGPYAFDGSTTAIDGNFVLDLSDIIVEEGGPTRYYLGVNDNTSGDTATLSGFKVVDLTTTPPTELVSSLVPQYPDNQQVYAYVDYAYPGPSANAAPGLSSPAVNPWFGTELDQYTYFVYYFDANFDIPSIAYVYIDGSPHTMSYGYGNSASDGYYIFQTSLTLGEHNYAFYFEDGRGGRARIPYSGTIWGPGIEPPHAVTQPNRPVGEIYPAPDVTYAYSTSGSICSNGHGVQYRFDWGDGETSDWLPEGQTSAEHSWERISTFHIKAQARCTADIIVESPWSDPLIVPPPAALPFIESFASAGIPYGWTQQNVGTYSDRWSLSESQNANGELNEMRCSYESVDPGTSRLVVRAIDTTGIESLVLRFKHYLDTYQTGGVELKVQTSPDRVIWTDESWSVITGSSHIGPMEVRTVITHNLNRLTTYVGFSISGNLNMFNDWYIDDISISAGFKHKVDFNKDGQEDLLWRCYGTGVMYGVPGQGWDVVWYMGETGAPSPLPLGNAQDAAGAMRRLTGAVPTKTYLSPLDVGGMQTAGPARTLVSPMEVGKLRTIGPARSLVSPMDVGIRSISWQERAARRAADLGRKLPQGDNPQIRGKDLSNNPVLLDTEKLAAGNAKTMAVDYSTDAPLYTVMDLDWEIAGAGDFDGNGSTDVLWRYYGAEQAQGTAIIWFMDGTTISRQGYPYRVSDTDWRIDRTGDFNVDGKADILWRYYGTGPAQGTAIIWYMNGSGILGQAYPYRVTDTDWKIDGIGDFNGDGRADLLWRYYGTEGAQGTTIIWYMDGTTILSQGYPYRVTDTDWKIDATGDFNWDGRTDIVWRYYGTGQGQGTTIIWYMNGAEILGQDGLYRVPYLDWRIVNR